jgi:hypothetical protein
MAIDMELAAVFTEPLVRRCWLLNKALEHASLDEALRLARAADEFLCMGQGHAPTLPGSEWGLLRVPPAPAEIPRPAAALTIAISARDRAKPAAGEGPTEPVASAAESLNLIGAEEIDASEKPGTEDAGDDLENGEPNVAMTSRLAVLAGMEDVVRYLRQQDDVVVSSGTGTYVVNGRFQLNSEELLIRANKIRQRQGKPQFQRFPSGFTVKDGGETPGRRQGRP